MRTRALILAPMLAAALMLPIGAAAANAAEMPLDPGTVQTVGQQEAPPTMEDPVPVETPAPASVEIVSAPSKWMQVVPFPMQLATTGFSEGNWVNVWVTNPDGVRHSQDGHFMKREDNPQAFANFMAGPGTYQVQISVGAWPEEQWSQIITVDVA